MDNACYFIVEEGEPYHKGDHITLHAKDFTLGRSSKEYQPDIIFDSLYVSRRHAALTSQDGKFFLTDLESTHGTQLNGLVLNAHTAYELKNNDQIKLAQGSVSLLFKCEPDQRKPSACQVFRLISIIPCM
jgi:pSer/pThr/pTyr-binding forkhead associated (FHA) protein